MRILAAIDKPANTHPVCTQSPIQKLLKISQLPNYQALVLYLPDEAATHIQNMQKVGHVFGRPQDPALSIAPRGTLVLRMFENLGH